MAFIPAQNVARFELIYTHNDVPVENVFHMHSSVTTWTNGDLADTAGTFKSWWDTYLQPLVHSTTTLDMILCTALSSQISSKLEYLQGLPLAGTSTDAPMPGNVTLAIKWLTGTRGRSARGRTFHVGLTEAQCTGNQLDESSYSTFLAAYTALPTYVNTSSKHLAVVSYRSNGAPRSSALVSLITECAINATLDTQRRRLA